ncbi:EF-G domain III/V-like [Sesbania bispinosa]|nr:EF-G domain III/V-like [Sesbania bispinosa]
MELEYLLLGLVSAVPSFAIPMLQRRIGLRFLNRSDPFVEVTVSARGEHVVAAAGQVHLEKCIKDLKDRIAKVSLEVSLPLVSYKETIEGEVMKLLPSLTKVLDESSDLLGDIIGIKKAQGRGLIVVVMGLKEGRKG